MCIQSNLGHSTSRLQRLTKVSTPVYQKTDKRVVGFGPKLPASMRSEEHTSELQSRLHLVCRLLLEKKNDSNHGINHNTFSVNVLNLFSRSRRNTNKRNSKHGAMLENTDTRLSKLIGLLQSDRKLA